MCFKMDSVLVVLLNVKVGHGEMRSFTIIDTSHNML